jgi:hypothetical protein
MDHANALALIITRLAAGAFTAFLAIIVWSRTRDIAWMFFVIGAIAMYGDIVYAALELFGIVSYSIVVVNGIEVVRLALSALPHVFFATAFIVFIARKGT